MPQPGDNPRRLLALRVQYSRPSQTSLVRPQPPPRRILLASSSTLAHLVTVLLSTSSSSSSSLVPLCIGLHQSSPVFISLHQSSSAFTSLGRCTLLCRDQTADLFLWVSSTAASQAVLACLCMTALSTVRHQMTASCSLNSVVITPHRCAPVYTGVAHRRHTSLQWSSSLSTVDLPTL